MCILKVLAESMAAQLKKKTMVKQSVYLHVSLGLHESTHHPETSIEVTGRGVRGHPWNDGMVGPLAWGQNIGMRRVQGKIGTTILGGGGGVPH